jgi:hypothetical protein
MGTRRRRFRWAPEGEFYSADQAEVNEIRVRCIGGMGLMSNPYGDRRWADRLTKVLTDRTVRMAAGCFPHTAWR